MSLAINSTVTNPYSTASGNSFSSASNVTGFSSLVPSSSEAGWETQRGATTASSTNSSAVSQFSSDIQSLFSQLQATGQFGSNQGADDSAGDTSGVASSDTSAVDPADALQTDVNNVVNDLFNLLPAAPSDANATPSSSSGVVTGFNDSAFTSRTDAHATSASSVTQSSTGLVITPSTSDTQTSAATPANGGSTTLAHVLAQDFAQAIQSYATANLQTTTTNQIISAA